MPPASAAAMSTVSTASVPLPDPPRGVIAALAHSPAEHRLFVATVGGRVHVYNDVDDVRSITGPAIRWRGEDLIVGVLAYEQGFILVHPRGVSIGSIDDETVQVKCNRVKHCELEGEDGNAEEEVYISAVVVEYMSVLLVATSRSKLLMFNLPDFTPLDTFKFNDNQPIQAFDAYLNYVVVALSDSTNVVLDISTRKFYHLHKQHSGFKYPVTTSLKILETIPSSQIHDFPQDLVYAQAGIEGKVSVVTTRMELQTEPTVTITTAAMSAPISSSIANNNPSGIVVNGGGINNAAAEPPKFIFRAHRTTLADGNVLVGPIHSLNTVDGYLVTAGSDASVCFWDVVAKRRVKMCRGFPASVVATVAWNGVLACASASDAWKNAPADEQGFAAIDVDEEETAVVLLLLGQ